MAGEHLARTPNDSVDVDDCTHTRRKASEARSVGNEPECQQRTAKQLASSVLDLPLPFIVRIDHLHEGDIDLLGHGSPHPA